MSEEMNQNPAPGTPPDNAEVMAQIKKIQEQLGYLEKKINTLLELSQEKSFAPKPFSKPFRPFKHPHHHPEDRRPRDRGFDRDKGFSKFRRDDRDGGFDRDRGPDRGRPSEKRHGDQGRGFVPKKKPFFLKRKDRG